MALGCPAQFARASGRWLMSEFAVSFVAQSSLLEDGLEQAPREFLAVKWNDRESPVGMNEFAVTAFAWEFLEACSTQFANDFFGSRRQRLPLLARSQRHSILLDGSQYWQANQNVLGFQLCLARGCPNRAGVSDLVRVRVQAPTQAPLASFRGRARMNRLVTSQRVRLERNRSRTWVRSGLETPIRCTFAWVQYSPGDLQRLGHSHSEAMA
jgi:hypothetical protein